MVLSQRPILSARFVNTSDAACFDKHSCGKASSGFGRNAKCASSFHTVSSPLAREMRSILSWVSSPPLFALNHDAHHGELIRHKR